MDLHQLSITELQERYRNGEATPREAVHSVLEAIETGDVTIGAYLSTDAEAALAAADAADISLPLGGIPIAIKDAINVEGQRTTCASKFLENFVSPYDATVITKLKAAGAIPLGKTNMDEFAMGSSTENSALGNTTNPWDASRIPGGSSGGSGAAVAADLAIAALGSDTGGSIRQPASHCGCVGLKPTYGRVSRFGLVAFASSLDQIGPMTKTAQDAALVLQAIAGEDTNDTTCLDNATPDYLASLNDGVKGLRIGLPKEYFIEGIEPGVKEAVSAAVRELESQGAEIVEVSLPHTEYAVATYYIIATAEASANLARFDGVRYGHRSAKEPESIVEHYKNTRAEGFGDEVKRRVILGTYVLSSGYYDAYYLRAQKVRTLIRDDFTKAFAEVDVIASPVCPAPAFKIGENTDDPLKIYLEDIFTIAANLAGICGISVPCGFCESTGTRLPVGLQLLGKPLGEAEILRAAHSYQNATDWHRAKPGR